MGKNAKKTPPLSTNGNASISNNDTDLILRAIENTMQILSNRFEKQENNIIKMQQSFDELTRRYSEQQQVILKLSEDNKQLEEENKVVKMNQQHLSAEVNTFKAKLNELNQEQLNNDVLITNLPMNDGINADSVVKNIFNLLRCDDRDITKKYKILNNKTGTRRKYHHICLTFKDDTTKEKFLCNKRKLGPIFWEQILPDAMTKDQNNSKEIYINEKLTSYNLQLVREARRRRKNGLLAFAWNQRGSVLARKIDGGPIHKLRLLDDLDRLCGLSTEDDKIAIEEQ
jgi:hypothetical protein